MSKEDISPILNQPKEPVPTITIEPFQHIGPETSRKELSTIDLNIANNMLDILHTGFGCARSLKTVTALIGTTMKVLSERRKAWEVENGSSGANPTKVPLIPLP